MKITTREQIAGPIPMNLQLFGNSDDMILPDDFQAESGEQAPAQPEAVEDINLEGQQTGEPTPQPEGEGKQQVQTEEPAQAPQVIKVKYNHQEMELPYEEAVQHIQKGLNYDKTLERLKALESDPRLSFVEAQARKYNMSPADYIEAVRQQEEQAELNELIQKNIPEEYAREMIENRKFREQNMKAQQEQKAEQEKRAKEDAEFGDFVKNYPEVKPEEIPKEVLEYRKETGKTLTEAMMWHENRELKNQLKVLKQNEENRKKAFGSSGVTTYGTNDTSQEDEFLRGFNSI